MNKKIYIILFLIIAIVIGEYYYYNYQKPEDLIEQVSQVEQTEPEEASESNECSIVVSRVIDGIFKKIENNILYLQIENQDSVEVIKLTNDTSFLRMNFSSTMEIIDQIDIALTELVEGDQISVIALCEECVDENECSQEKIALTVRHMNVEVER